MPALSTEPEFVVVDSQGLVIRDLGRQPYVQVWQAMQKYTDERTEQSPDQLWFVEHDPVFTQGQAGKAEHLLMPGDIPVVQVDRGGQVTYHGPGQLVAYVLLDIKRRKLGVRQLVTLIEQVIIKALASYGIDAYAKADAPGVYVQEQKLASLGLRVRKGCTFHGLALNVNMDLSPFSRINPCGYAGMQMIQTKDIAGPQNVDQAKQALQSQFVALLAVSQTEHKTGLSE